MARRCQFQIDRNKVATERTTYWALALSVLFIDSSYSCSCLPEKSAWYGANIACWQIFMVGSFGLGWLALSGVGYRHFAPLKKVLKGDLERYLPSGASEIDVMPRCHWSRPPNENHPTRSRTKMFMQFISLVADHKNNGDSDSASKINNTRKNTYNHFVVQINIVWYVRLVHRLRHVSHSPLSCLSLLAAHPPTPSNTPLIKCANNMWYTECISRCGTKLMRAKTPINTWNYVRGKSHTISVCI